MHSMTSPKAVNASLACTENERSSGRKEPGAYSCVNARMICAQLKTLKGTKISFLKLRIILQDTTLYIQLKWKSWIVFNKRRIKILESFYNEQKTICSSAQY